MIGRTAKKLKFFLNFFSLVSQTHRTVMEQEVGVVEEQCNNPLPRGGGVVVLPYHESANRHNTPFVQEWTEPHWAQPGGGGYCVFV